MEGIPPMPLMSDKHSRIDVFEDFMVPGSIADGVLVIRGSPWLPKVGVNKVWRELAMP